MLAKTQARLRAPVHTSLDRRGRIPFSGGNTTPVCDDLLSYSLYIVYRTPRAALKAVTLPAAVTPSLQYGREIGATTSPRCVRPQPIECGRTADDER